MGTWILKGGVEGRGRSGLSVFIHNSLLPNFQKDFLNGIIASVNHDGDCVEAFDTRPADIRYGLEGLNR